MQYHIGSTVIMLFAFGTVKGLDFLNIREKVHHGPIQEMYLAYVNLV